MQQGAAGGTVASIVGGETWIRNARRGALPRKSPWRRWHAKACGCKLYRGLLRQQVHRGEIFSSDAISLLACGMGGALLFRKHCFIIPFELSLGNSKQEQWQGAFGFFVDEVQLLTQHAGTSRGCRTRHFTKEMTPRRKTGRVSAFHTHAVRKVVTRKPGTNRFPQHLPPSTKTRTFS